MHVENKIPLQVKRKGMTYLFPAHGNFRFVEKSLQNIGAMWSSIFSPYSGVTCNFLFLIIYLQLEAYNYNNSYINP